MERRERDKHLLILALAGLTATLLQLSLHLRPGPLGMPISENPARSLLDGALWEWLTFAALSAPFLFLGPFLASRKSFKAARLLRISHTVAAFAVLTAGHAEHELQRFMGTHLTLDYLATYGRLGQSPSAIGYALADDAGGPYSAVFLALLPVLFLLAALLGPSDRRRRVSPSLAGGRFTGLLVAALVAPPAGSGPSIQPQAMGPPARTGLGVLWSAMVEAIGRNTGPGASSLDYQLARKAWTQRGEKPDWIFADARHPLWRVPARPCQAPPKPSWNFVIIQLETFRAMDMRSFNQELQDRPTAFLDALADDPKSASWVRFYANGIPTVSAFMAMHTSLLPHSQKRVATAFRGLALDAFPSLLRKEGYHAIFATGADPSWDGQRYWAERWYDEVHFDPRYDGRDDLLFDAVAQRLLDRGPSLCPFVITIVTSTNHLPFQLPGENAKDVKDLPPRTRLHRTMAFTDRALKEFFDQIRGASWFKNTVFVLTGDHGYDLGERGISGRMTNLRHENTWVPLIIHADHPALPRGRHETVASHIDLAPTLLKLSGVCRPSAFFGHDLTRLEPSGGFALTIREGAMALETRQYSFYFPPTGRARIYLSEDQKQAEDIFSSVSTAFVVRHEKFARGLSRVFDGLYESGSVRPFATPGLSSSSAREKWVF